MLYAGVQLAWLIRSAGGIGSVPSFYGTIESSISFSASLGLIWLSTWAHERSIRPSSLTTAYLLAKLCFCPQWAPVSNYSEGSLFTFALPCSTLILLGLELHAKTPLLFEAYVYEPPEVTTSFFGNTLFWWINPILAQGYRRSLSEDDIPMLDQNISSMTLRESILKAWNQRGA